MSQLDILVPFGLAPAAFARDIGHALKLPAISALLAKSRSRNALPVGSRDDDAGFARSLPHERWLGATFGIPGNNARTSPPVAPAAMRRAGIDPGDGWWFLLQPVHLHIALDHLVLTDSRHLPVSEPEAQALFAAAQPLFAESGLELRYGNPSEWFVRADAWSDLLTATPDTACGRNIDIWQPKGTAALAWRKLQNEVQMTWFGHPVQDEREARGQKPLNSLWMWGGGSAKHVVPGNPYDNVIGLQSPWDSLAPHARELDASGFPEHLPQRLLVVLDALTEPALRGDWGSWIEHYNRMETDWFAPSLAALRDGKIDSLTLLIGDGERLLSWTCGRMTLRKFWLKPSFAGILQ